MMNKIIQPSLVITFLIFVIFFSLVGIANAFDGWEHEALGNVSLEANLLHLKTMDTKNIDQGKLKAAVRFLSALQQVKDDENTKYVPYGKIVLLVDFMKDNYNLTRRMDSESGWPNSPTNSNWEYLKELNDSAMLSASHVNQNHFQGRTFYMFWFWHKQAVEAAAEGNLWGGLLLNAFADHFLQDSFAPGHIIAPRDENSQDVFSLMVHDSYNRIGLEYVIRRPQDCHFALSMLMDLPIEQRTNKLQLKIAALNDFANATNSFPVMCYGDGLINSNEREPVLISAYCVQSLWDVVKSFLDSTTVNSFSTYKWDLRFGAASFHGQLEFIDVQRSFGEMICVDRKMDTITGIQKTPIYVGSTNGFGKKVSISEIDSGIVAPLVLAGAKNPVFGFDFGTQAVTESSRSHLQGLVEGEMMVLGGRWDYLKQDFPRLPLPRWPSQFGLSLGYSGLFDMRTAANGPMTRLVLPIADLNCQLSLYAGARYYYSREVSGWGDFEGARFEWGLDLANLFVGVGHDHFATDAGRLVDTPSFQAGVSVALPLSRMPLFGSAK